MDVQQKFEKLYQQIDNCKRCPLGFLEINKPPRLRCKHGNIPILVVSQNPSTHRDPNCPWVYGGLDILFHYISIQKLAQAVWITNLVKCSTPRNRGLRKTEIKACENWLTEEIKIIQPQKILGLGKDACKWFNDNGYNYIEFQHPNYIVRFQKQKLGDYINALKSV